MPALTQNVFTATALQNEPLDALVSRVLKAGSGVVEQVLALNRGIADIAQALPEGHLVTLPLITAAAVPENRIINLWD